MRLIRIDALLVGELVSVDTTGSRSGLVPASICGNRRDGPLSSSSVSSASRAQNVRFRITSLHGGLHSLGEITALDHEALDDAAGSGRARFESVSLGAIGRIKTRERRGSSLESGSFVSETLFARREGPEVLYRLGHGLAVH